MSKEIQCEKCGRKYWGICECIYPIEDEFILRLVIALGETVKFWVESNQKERIYEEYDKFTIAITSYMYGVMTGKR